MTANASPLRNKKCGQLGGRLIDATAKKLAGQFFLSFGELVGSAAN
jgi:carbon monoxide dehydrogenase subunit G